MTTNPYQAPNASSQASMTNCKGCQKEIHVHATTCPNCGMSQRTRGYKNKIVTGFLAMFLGAFGIHRFYLGQWWGIAYLVTFWTFIPSIVSFFEAIYFWVRDQVKWDNKYNEGKAAGPNEKTNGITIAVMVIVIGFIVVAFIGILAAAALPAYHDYTLRAKVSQALFEASPTKSQIEDFYRRNTVMPVNSAELGMEDPHVLESGHTITLGNDGSFVITLNDKNTALDEKTIVMSPYSSDRGFEWDCTGGDLPRQYRLASCRSE